MKKRAFIFDLNGTMIDDMHYHAKAWYDILNNDLKAGVSWDEVKVQMYGKNSELLERIFGKNHFSDEQMKQLSLEKERKYQHEFLPKLSLILGLSQFLEKAKQQDIPMAIGTAAIPFNADFVLDNLKIRDFFKAIVSADDVVESKPHPETFLKCAQILNVEPSSCVVFEDAPKGVEAALNAGMESVVLTTTHPAEDFSLYKNVISCIKDYSGISPDHFIIS